MYVHKKKKKKKSYTWMVIAELSIIASQWKQFNCSSSKYDSLKRNKKEIDIGTSTTWMNLENILCQINHLRPYAVWFLLCEMFRIGKSIET